MRPKDWKDEKPRINKLALELSELWDNKPFGNNNGLGAQGSLTLYYYMKRLLPSLVFEIGCWRGFSTWVIEQAVQHKNIITSDPVFALQQFFDKSIYEPTYRPKGVQYTSQDFSVLNVNIQPQDRDKTFLFFDDHQDKIARLIQAKQKGFKHILFDDNLPFPYTHKTFQKGLADDHSIRTFLKEVKTYEIFPPLYDAKYFRNHNLKLEGLNIPKNRDYNFLYQERDGYTWITYVELH